MLIIIGKLKNRHATITHDNVTRHAMVGQTAKYRHVHVKRKSFSSALFSRQNIGV